MKGNFEMKGLSKETIEEISISRGEPDWLREFRLRSYHVFMSKSMPKCDAALISPVFTC
jgi:Fe-S cluster assembly protein SufB